MWVMFFSLLPDPVRALGGLGTTNLYCSQTVDNEGVFSLNLIFNYLNIWDE